MVNAELIRIALMACAIQDLPFFRISIFGFRVSGFGIQGRAS